MPVYNLPGITDISLTSGVAKSAIGITTPATRRAKIRGFQFGGSSVTQTDAPILFEITIGNTVAGTSTAQTPRPNEPAEPAALCTGQANYTAEPTGGTLLQMWAIRLSPIGASIIYDIPVDQRFFVPISTIAMLRVTSQSTLTLVRVGLIFEE